MTIDGSGGIKYLKHKEDFNIKENSIKYWVRDAKEFPGWEQYVPDQYVIKIKKQSLRKKVDDREHVNYDSKHFLSVLKSMNPVLYKQKLRQKFQLRDKKLKLNA